MAQYSAYWIAVADGLPVRKGELRKRKFCATCVLLMFRLARDGESHRQIAHRFDASASTIGDLLKRHTYKNIHIAPDLLPPNIYPPHGGNPRKDRGAT